MTTDVERAQGAEAAISEVTPAQSYEEFFGPAIFDPLATVTLRHAAPRPGERVLDLACGTGIVTRRVAAAVGPGGRVLGLDVNPAMLAEAASRPRPPGAPVEWRQGDAVRADLSGEEFDLVVCQQGLQFFTDRSAGVRLMRRCLAPGGRAVVAVWRGLEVHPLYRALADAELPHLVSLGADVTLADLEAPFSLGDADELRRLVEEAGFEHVTLAETTIEARFPTPERFVERMEYAYAAVIPAFAADASAFADYLGRITRATRDIVAEHVRGNHVVVPMHTRLVVARA